MPASPLATALGPSPAAAAGDGPAQVAAGAINRVIRHYVHTAHAAADALRMPREAIAVISARSAAIRADLAAYRQARAWFEAACVAPIPG